MLRPGVALAVVLAVALAVGSASGEPGNLIATTATYYQSYIRGYTCGTWSAVSGEGRVSYILGVVALADTLASSGQVYGPMLDAVRLPLSAVAYRPLVDAGCAYSGPAASVLAVLYTLK